MKNTITMKKIIITIVITFCIGCAPKSFLPPQPKIGEPERLDITRFENHKSKYNDYYIIDNENIEIRQSFEKYDNTYYEFTNIPKEKRFPLRHAFLGISASYRQVTGKLNYIS